MKDSYFYLPGHRENLGSIEIERGVPENSMILIDEDDTGESFYADWGNLLFFRKPGTNEDWTHKVFLSDGSDVSEKVSVKWINGQLEICSEDYLSSVCSLEISIKSSTKILPWPLVLKIKIDLNLPGFPIEITKKEFYVKNKLDDTKIEIMVNNAWLKHYNTIQIFDHVSRGWKSLKSEINTFDVTIIQRRVHVYFANYRKERYDLGEGPLDFYFIRLGDSPSSETLFLVPDFGFDFSGKRRETVCYFGSPNWKKSFNFQGKKYIWLLVGDMFQAWEKHIELKLEDEKLRQLLQTETEHPTQYLSKIPKNVSFTSDEDTLDHSCYVASWLMFIDDYKEEIIHIGEEE